MSAFETYLVVVAGVMTVVVFALILDVMAERVFGPRDDD